jgi:hypothetical protein
MSKRALTAAAASIAMIASAQADAPVYVLDNWPGDMDNIPCRAWQKSPDGTWVLHATVKVGASELTNIAVKGDAAAHKLDRQCGAKK